MSPTSSELREIAKIVRRDVLTMVLEAGSGHVGGSLSCADILVALYWQVLRIRPERPTWEDRDRFVLSKAHAAPALYAALARRGYFEMRDLLTFRKLKSKLQGTPDPHRTAGVDVSVGSQGEGLSIANGIAVSARRAGKGFRVYCLLGDGELQEGQVWEAALTAAHLKLDSVCAIVDRNGLMGAGATDEIAALGPLADKWRAFNWRVSEVDGHDLDQLTAAFTEASSVKGQPAVIIANTVKGKGVPFMEGKVEWHDRKLTVDVYEEAMKALT
ncbi:MAG: transketolase [Candidatus Eisenbacteria bacterium]|nr:transketolase [Candidatus Eisenbacteria bacterium]